MPAIQTYRGTNGEMIPVSEANEITAYRCPWTKQLIPTKRKYVNHLKRLRRDRMHRKAQKLRIDRAFQEYFEQPDLASIVNWIHNNPDLIWQRVDDAGSIYRGDAEDFAKIRNDFWLKITYLDVGFEKCLSNSHSAPRGQKTNWGRRAEGVPVGYPGWGGRIEFQLSHNLPGFFSSFMSNILHFHTGTGSGVSKNRFGFDVKIWLDDFPGLAKTRTMEILQDKPDDYFRYGVPRYFK